MNLLALHHKLSVFFDVTNKSCKYYYVVLTGLYWCDDNGAASGTALRVSALATCSGLGGTLAAGLLFTAHGLLVLDGEGAQNGSC